jgi:hypothetical protein
MPLRILIYLLFLTLILSNSLNGQIIWEEDFDTPNKGIWADSSGNVHSDLTSIKWTIDTSCCTFNDENDYAKTVSTSGGRFEILDSDGEITWKSKTINIEGFDLANIKLTASETGSGSVENKKYVKAFYELDNTLFPFSPHSSVHGNWGEKVIQQKSISGKSLRIIIKMNSSYANDKVIIDNIVVEAVDENMLNPRCIQITNAPIFTFVDSLFTIGAIILNGYGEPITESNIPLMLTFNDTRYQVYPDSTCSYIWHIITGVTGDLNISIDAPEYEMKTAQKIVTVYSPTNISTNINFENNTFPTNFELFNNWKISTDEPLAGKYSIKHKPNKNGGIDSLNYILEGSMGQYDDEIVVSFMLKNGDWDPSSSNSFYLKLIPPQGSNEKALAIGVNAKGSSDMFSVWTIENGGTADLLAETNFNWNPSQNVQVSIIRKPGGKWSVVSSDQGAGKTSKTTFNYQYFSELSKLQLIFNHTQTRSGLLWFDDLLILSKNSPPAMLSAKTINTGQFSITFTEPIDTSGLTPNNFKIITTNGEAYNIDSIKICNPATICLSTQDAPHQLSLQIYAQNITDTEGATIEKDSLVFQNVRPARKGDIVINEIMPDPYPAVELPEEEYIEIFNRSDKNISLLNWKVKVRKTARTISDSLVLAPGEYFILCDKDYAESFSDYGMTCGLDGFPALLNSGAKISIFSKEQILIDEISYSDSWHQLSEKKNGGYSIERIDVNRFCAQQYNWASSESETGGTPGYKNSMSGKNIDSEPPTILSKKIKTLSKIEVIFSEDIDTTNISTIHIDCTHLKATSINIEKETLSFTVHPALTNKNSYTFSISNIGDECGNTADMFQLSVLVNTPQSNDLLISELLFNPVPDGNDFIEIHNNSALPADLSSLYLATRDDSLKLHSVTRITTQEFMLPSHSYCAITTNAQHLLEKYIVPDKTTLLNVDKIPPMYNSEGLIVLLNDSLKVIDEAYYNEAMHSDWLYDNEGVSLERISFLKPANSPENWQSASSLAGFATPGYKNSQFTDELKSNDIKVELESDIVSPNGDNYHDELIIGLSGSTSGYLINLFVFDVNGIEEKRVFNNELAGTHNEIIYNLENNNGLTLQDGTYILYLEMTHPEKEAFTCKKAFHITQ